MKTIFTKILLMSLFTASSFSQSDSIMYLNKTDFSLNIMREVRYESSGLTIEKDLIDLENVNKLTFLRNDSLILYKRPNNMIYTGLVNINEVSKYKYRFSPFLGTTIGIIGGGLLGGVIGLAASGSNSASGENMFAQGISKVVDNVSNVIIGALLGAVSGGIIGSMITDSINHVSLDLSSVPDKDKKTELIKFLRHR